MDAVTLLSFSMNMVESPSLKVFKMQLVSVLHNLIVTLLSVEGWTRQSSNLDRSVISVFSESIVVSGLAASSKLKRVNWKAEDFLPLFLLNFVFIL